MPLRITLKLCILIAILHTNFFSMKFSTRFLILTCLLILSASNLAYSQFNGGIGRGGGSGTSAPALIGSIPFIWDPNPILFSGTTSPFTCRTYELTANFSGNTPIDVSWSITPNTGVSFSPNGSTATSTIITFGPDAAPATNYQITVQINDANSIIRTATSTIAVTSFAPDVFPTVTISNPANSTATNLCLNKDITVVGNGSIGGTFSWNLLSSSASGTVSGGSLSGVLSGSGSTQINFLPSTAGGTIEFEFSVSTGSCTATSTVTTTVFASPTTGTISITNPNNATATSLCNNDEVTLSAPVTTSGNS